MSKKHDSIDSDKPLLTPNGLSKDEPIFLSIDRPIVNQTSLYINDLKGQDNEDQDKESRIKTLTKSYLRAKKGDTRCAILKKWVFGLFPILAWLPSYDVKSDLSYDLIAGFTVAVFNIPQGMAYSLLANLPPIHGLYMAFFPVLIYACMGTSRHLAVGTFAVISLMSGQVVSSQVAAYQAHLTGPENINQTLSDEELHDELEHFAIEVGAALCFMVGVWQALLGTLKLGSISVLLFPELVSGFTTGAAFHVITSQIKGLFGLNIPRVNGFFKIILTYINILISGIQI